MKLVLLACEVNLIDSIFLITLRFMTIAQIRPDLGRIEKWVLRNAFDDEKNPYLPKVRINFCLMLILMC